jgi:hypothetical protein
MPHATASLGHLLAPLRDQAENTISPVAALCCTKIQKGRSRDRNRPLSWVGDRTSDLLGVK